MTRSASQLGRPARVGRGGYVLLSLVSLHKAHHVAHGFALGGVPSQVQELRYPFFVSCASSTRGRMRSTHGLSSCGGSHVHELQERNDSGMTDFGQALA